MKTFERKYGENCLLVADISEKQDEFSHEFGTETYVYPHVDDLRVISYIGDFDFDVTDSIKNGYPKMYEFFMEMMKEKYLEYMND